MLRQWNAGNSISPLTSRDFGTGKANTATMISKWNGGEHGTQNKDGSYLDMWGVIQSKVNSGWFVPSEQEWVAVEVAFGLTSSNYQSFGFRDNYWASSLSSGTMALDTRMSYTETNGYCMGMDDVESGGRVRLATTF